MAALAGFLVLNTSTAWSQPAQGESQREYQTRMELLKALEADARARTAEAMAREAEARARAAEAMARERVANSGGGGASGESGPKKQP